MLGSVAPRKVEAILNGPLGESCGKYFASAVMHSLSAADPREYLRVAEKPDAKSPPRYWARALAALAATDPQGAVAEWSRWGTKRRGKNALSAILGAWVQQDASAARQWVESEDDANTRRTAQHAWLSVLSRYDLATARRTMSENFWFVGGIGGGEDQDMQSLCVEIAAATARQDLPAALEDLLAVRLAINQSRETAEYLKGQPESLDPCVAMRRAIVEAAAASLPDEPAALFAALENLRAKAGAVLDGSMEGDLILGKMRNRDAATVLETARMGAERLQATGETQLWAQEWLPRLISSAAGSDPAATVEFISTLPPDVRGLFASTALGSFSETDPALIARAAGFLTANECNGALGQQLAIAPQATASIVAALPVNINTGEARSAFAGSWARRDPAAAAQWVAALPPDAGSAQAARGVTDAWARYDDTAASAWAASLPQGPARDGAALGLAASTAAAEPESAWQWAASISDARLSAQAFGSVARLWGNEAPPEFRAALSAAMDRGGYDAESRESCLRALNQPRQLTQPPPPPP